MSEAFPNGIPSRENIRLDLAQKSIEKVGLYDDVKNVWNIIGTLGDLVELYSPTEALEKTLVSEFQHHQEYIESYHGPAITGYVLEHSDSGKVRQFDAFVDQANSIRAQALEDLQTGGAKAPMYIGELLAIHKKAMALINGEPVDGE